MRIDKNVEIVSTMNSRFPFYSNFIEGKRVKFFKHFSAIVVFVSVHLLMYLRTNTKNIYRCMLNVLTQRLCSFPQILYPIFRAVGGENTSTTVLLQLLYTTFLNEHHKNLDRISEELKNEMYLFRRKLEIIRTDGLRFF